EAELKDGRKKLMQLPLEIGADTKTDKLGRSGRWGVWPGRGEAPPPQYVASFELGAKPTVAPVFTGAYLPPAADRKLDLNDGVKTIFAGAPRSPGPAAQPGTPAVRSGGGAWGRSGAALPPMYIASFELGAKPTVAPVFT